MRDGGGVCDVHRVVVEVGECGGFLTKNKQKRGGVSCVMCVYMTGRTDSGTERHVDVNESVWIRALEGGTCGEFMGAGYEFVHTFNRLGSVKATTRDYV